MTSYLMLYTFEPSETGPAGDGPILRPAWRRHPISSLGGASVRPNSKERRPGRNGMARTVLFLAAAMTPSFALAREGSDSSSGGKVQALTRLGEEL
jgi:hypothetical protein